jgi:hypothetical protein
LKAFKKEFACNGSLVDDEDMGQVIQLQGDQRTKIHDMLVEEGISEFEGLCRKTTTRKSKTDLSDNLLLHRERDDQTVSQRLL